MLKQVDGIQNSGLKLEAPRACQGPFTAVNNGEGCDEVPVVRQPQPVVVGEIAPAMQPQPDVVTLTGVPIATLVPAIASGQWDIRVHLAQRPPSALSTRTGGDGLTEVNCDVPLCY